MTKKKTTRKSHQRKPVEQQQSGIDVIMSAILQAVGKLGKWTFITILAICLLIAVVGYITMQKITDNNANIEIDQRIGITPTQIESMKAIGQWEFLSIADEELIDTVRNGFFKDDELIRI